MALKKALILLLGSYLLFGSLLSYGHHVLGRPSYSLNEDSNTPPSLAIETQIGEYFVTYMVFPAFPKPNERGRLNLYVTRIDNGLTLNEAVTFSVSDDSALPSFLQFNQNPLETIGTQRIDDGVYRQGFTFSEEGKYLIRAQFESGGENYEIDFPLQVGTASAIGPIGISISLIVILLIGINLVQRKRIALGKIQQGQKSP